MRDKGAVEKIAEVIAAFKRQGIQGEELVHALEAWTKLEQDERTREERKRYNFRQPNRDDII